MKNMSIETSAVRVTFDAKGMNILSARHTNGQGRQDILASNVELQSKGEFEFSCFLATPFVGRFQTAEKDVINASKAGTTPIHGFSRHANFSILEHGGNRVVAEHRMRPISPFAGYTATADFLANDQGFDCTLRVVAQTPGFLAAGLHPYFALNGQDEVSCQVSYEVSLQDGMAVGEVPCRSAFSLKLSDAVAFDRVFRLAENDVWLRSFQSGLHTKIHLWGDCRYLGLYKPAGVSAVTVEPLTDLPWHEDRLRHRAEVGDELSVGLSVSVEKHNA